MKKFAILILALLLALPLTGCQGGQTGHSINVYNWGEYIDESIFDDFEAETGIHVNYKTFASNEMLYSAIKGAGPCNVQRMQRRRQAFNDGAWVREAALAHEQKRATREEAA